MSQEQQDLNDPLSIVNEKPDPKTLLKESLDSFEREIWPIYEARGYDKNFALLSYSTGVFTDLILDIMDCGDDCEECKGRDTETED